MALWGNKDAGIGTMGLASAVSVNYATKTVTGAGTTFGRVGAAGTGDVLVFGDRTGTASTYFGLATIVSVASTTSVTIGSTAALSGDPISNISVWKVKQSPTYGEVDPALSYDPVLASDSSLEKVYANINSPAAVASLANDIGCGVSVFPVLKTDLDYHSVIEGDTVKDPGSSSTFRINKVGQASVSALAAVAANEVVLRFAKPPGIAVGDFVQGQPGSIAALGSTTSTVSVSSGATANYIHVTDLETHNLLVGDLVVTPKIATGVAIGTVTTDGSDIVWLVTGASSGGTITAGMALTFTSDTIITLGAGATTTYSANDEVLVNGDYISVGGTTTGLIGIGSNYAISRASGGYDSYVYGVANVGKDEAAGTQYAVDSTGWVGVTTYTDCSGNLRVKKEVLVAMSGITTGDRLPFPAYPNVGNQA